MFIKFRNILYLLEERNSNFKYKIKKLKIGERMYNRNNNFGTRTMHKATCSDCGTECEVPFEPKEGRPVYCRDCYRKHRR
jgi:CxxC-x17-CxxC domain-containing protein